MKTSKRLGYLGIILFVLLVGATSCAGPGSDQDSFRGKTVTIIIPYGEGGGIDSYARAVAPFLQKYLPGAKVETRNITEAGGVTGKNQVFAARPDGLTLGFTPMSGALLAEWQGIPGVQYKTAEFSIIGRITSEAHVMVVSPKSGFRTLDDFVQVKKIKMGFSGLGSDDYFVGLTTANLLGYQVEARTEYLSANDAGLACVRGDVDAILFSYSSVQAQIAAKTVIPVVSFSETRLASLPNVPTIFEVMPADKQKIIQGLVRIYALDRMMIAPPHLPVRELKVLREALDQAVADPEFLQTMTTLKRPVEYLTGAQVATLLESILSNEDQIKPLVLMVAQGSR